MVSKTPLKTFSQKITHEKMANHLIYKMYLSMHVLCKQQE